MIAWKRETQKIAGKRQLRTHVASLAWPGVRFEIEPRGGFFTKRTFYLTVRATITDGHLITVHFWKLRDAKDWAERLLNGQATLSLHQLRQPHL